MNFGVVSVPETVTVSTSITQQTPSTNVAYLITFNNNGGSAVQSTLVFGDLTTTAGLTGAAILDGLANPALPAACTVTTTTFNCDFGTVGPGAAINFPLIVKAPQYAVGGSTENQKLTLLVTSTHREGNSTSGNSITTLTASVDTPVAAQSTTSMKSVVVKQGSFFTGGNGIPKSTDVYTSAVAFQALEGGVVYSLVTIDEVPFPATDAKCIGGKHFKTCFGTKLHAPAVVYTAGGFLTEIIRAHPDNFKPGAANKMGTVIWEYTPTDADGNPIPLPPNASPFVVGMCASPTTPRSDGFPCQAAPVKCYTSDKVPGWTPELDGVCEWPFINRRNGFQRGY